MNFLSNKHTHFICIWFVIFEKTNRRRKVLLGALHIHQKSSSLSSFTQHHPSWKNQHMWSVEAFSFFAFELSIFQFHRQIVIKWIQRNCKCSLEILKMFILQRFDRTMRVENCENYSNVFLFPFLTHLHIDIGKWREKIRRWKFSKLFFLTFWIRIVIEFHWQITWWCVDRCESMRWGFELWINEISQYVKFSYFHWYFHTHSTRVENLMKSICIDFNSKFTHFCQFYIHFH